MELHLSVKGLPTRYDELIIAVVELADGEHATWFASNPDDAPKAVSKALKASAIHGDRRPVDDVGGFERNQRRGASP